MRLGTILLLLLGLQQSHSKSFNLFKNYVVEDPRQTEIQDGVRSSCWCRERCFVQPTCQAVSITSGSRPGTFKCMFSSQYGTGNTVLRPQHYLKEDPQVRTYVKGFSCYPPMRFVRDVDCLYFSTSKMTRNDAKTKGCPGSTKLYAPPSEKVYSALAKFLIEESYTGDYWLWIDLLIVGVWVWEDGKYSYGTNAAGAGVWDASNPGGGAGDLCAKMRQATKFKLSDRACSEAYYFICVMA